MWAAKYVSSAVLGESIPADAKGKSFYDLKAVLPRNKGEYDFSTLKGKPVLIINTASKCGFTPQFTGLEELNKTYGDRGLVVLGFPSNEFGNQDPGSDEAIAEFCQVNHGVSFQLMAKSTVNGSEMNPVFAWLKSNAPSKADHGSIKWNFTKFLVDSQGNVVGRFGPNVTPAELKGDIEKVLPSITSA